MTEQRKSERFTIELPLEVIPLPPGSEPLSAEIRNMSSCGILFTSSHPFEVGDQIEFLVTLPSAKGSKAPVRLHCVGRVVRENGSSGVAATLERYEFVRGKGRPQAAR